jgi:hypothetical protein
MFESVNIKIDRAKFFLNQFKTEQIGTNSWRAYLDAFFFELVSAKDFFLQGINDKYGLGLHRDQATKFYLLKRNLAYPVYSDALEVVENIEENLCNSTTWQWKLNNYRNSATHRELLHLGYEAGKSDHVEVYLFEDPEDNNKGNMKQEVIPYCQESLDKLEVFLNEQFAKLS